MRCLDDITDSVDMNLGKIWEMVKDRETWHAADPWDRGGGYDLATEHRSSYHPSSQFCL